MEWEAFLHKYCNTLMQNNRPTNVLRYEFARNHIMIRPYVILHYNIGSFTSSFMLDYSSASRIKNWENFSGEQNYDWLSFPTTPMSLGLRMWSQAPLPASQSFETGVYDVQTMYEGG